MSSAKGRGAANRSGSASRHPGSKAASSSTAMFGMRKPAAKGTPPKSSKQFEDIDKDGSGVLSISELKALLTRPDGGAPLSDKDIAEVIAQFDTDGDGQISYKEFLAMCEADAAGSPTPPPPRPASALPKTTRDAFAVFDKDGSGSLSVGELRAVLSRPDGGAPLSDEAISQMIAKFDKNGDGELQIDEFSAMWTSMEPSNTSSQPAKAASAKPAPSKASSSGTASRSSKLGLGAPTKTAAASANPTTTKKSKDWRVVLHKYESGQEHEMLTGAIAQSMEIQAAEFLQQRASMGLLTSLQLEEAAAEQRQRAEEEDKASNKKFTSLAVRVAEALLRKEGSTPIEDLMKKWDPNQDGSISKLEFRVNIRKLVDPTGRGDKFAVEEIDSLFAELDVDRGGSISMAELKAALKRLQEKTAAAGLHAEAFQQRAQDWRDKAELTTMVAALTKLAETAVDQLDMATEASKSLVRNTNDKKHSGVGKGSLNRKVAASSQVPTEGNSAGAQLGSIMVRKGFKAEDVVSKWDTSGDGVIQIDEFRREVLALGVVCEAAEIDRLFQSLDGDGGGSLDLPELKEALKKLEEAAFAARQSVRLLSQNTMELVNAMKKAQQEWRDERQAEEEAAAADAAKLAQISAEAAAIEAAAEAKREAGRAAKKAAAAEEKANADARIAAKRAAQR